jgi:beta-lactamase superfamily II metal-dependent hydrolase
VFGTDLLEQRICVPLSGQGGVMFADVEGPSFIFWPVGNGDSTTVVISDTEVLQIDLNDKVMVEDDDNEHIPLVDELVAKLPRRNGKPYLSCFVLTHPDQDHCRGFADLLKRVVIGELWHSPHIFREYEDQETLCEDAQVFRKEARRRAARAIKVGGDPGAGDRVRIIGYSSLFEPGERYHGFPDEFRTRPGAAIVKLDGVDASDRFHAFIHGPFKEGVADARNETSVAMRIIVGSIEHKMFGLFLGDVSYPTLMQIFEETHNHNNDDMLWWNVLLAPHHCSKKVMYERDGEGPEKLRQDAMNELQKPQLDVGYIVSSSSEFPASNSPGDNPPHIKARNRYEEIVNDDFLCTAEHSTPENVRPIIFTVNQNGMELVGEDYEISESARATLAAAVNAARGRAAPPTAKVGFGRE